jgi:uncharacterized protein YcnI
MTAPALRALAVLAGASALFAAGTASAHITIFPRQATLGAEQKYTVRAPNERKVATFRIEGEFPPELKVSSLDEKPGWTVEPRRDAAGAIVGAVWTGVLPAEGFTEFGVNARNPGAGESVTWKFTQYYEGGETVHWTGPRGSKTPAPVVTLVAPAAP